MASIFQTNEITQGGLRLIAEATSANPIVYIKALSASQIPQDPEIENFYNGIEGEIDASAATDNVARVVALYGNNITNQPQDVKAIAIMGRLSSQSDSQAVIFAYCYDADSQIKFPSSTAPAQRTRFAFNFAFDQVENVSVTEAGSASLADLRRLVSCHKAGDPEAGEDQTILGDKTWEDQQDFNEACRFHDTISTHNVYPDGSNFNVGSEQAEYNHVYAKYGTFSTSLQAASALVQSTLIANRVNARSELDIKGATIIGKKRMVSDYYAYELQVHGGDKYDTPQTGVCGKLDILPTITVTDPSSGDETDYTAEINMGNAAHRFSEIYAMRVNQKSFVLQPVDGTLDDATMLYAEKVPEPGDESGRYYEYAIYIKTPETPLGEAWNYAIVPDQNEVDLGYTSKPFYSLYLESGIVLGSTTNYDGGIRLCAERTNADTQGHYDLNLDIWMACGANHHTWDNFNITPWTGGLAQKINLGTDDRPFNNEVLGGTNGGGTLTFGGKSLSGGYYSGAINTIKVFWGETQDYQHGDKDGYRHFSGRVFDLPFVNQNNGLDNEPMTLDGVKLSIKILDATSKYNSQAQRHDIVQKTFSFDIRNLSNKNLTNSTTPTEVTVPVGGLVQAIPSDDWLSHNHNERFYAGYTLRVRDGAGQTGVYRWNEALLDVDASSGNVQWNRGLYISKGTYRFITGYQVGNGAVPDQPILLQKIKDTI
jgi:hypothetical protein